MNFLFKLKHYVRPYFEDTYYSGIQDIEAFTAPRSKYWITGYESNVAKKKWTFEDGIPMGLYNSEWSGNKAKRTHISALTEYFFALDIFEQKDECVRIVDFIIKNLHEDACPVAGKYRYWRTFLSDHNSDYFVHGMGQGQILSALIRAKMIDNNNKLDDIIVQVANSFKVKFTDKNGFVDRSDGTILQEYPHMRSVSNAVLNGWVLSAIGLYDYLHAGFKDPLIQDIFEDTILTLKNKLSEYDIGYWTLYNLPTSYKNIASAHYHGQHIVFLNILGLLLDDPILIQFSKKTKMKSNNIKARLLALFVKVFANIIKDKRLYKSK